MPSWYSFRYSSDTLQTRKPFWYSFRFQPQIHSRHGSHSDTHSDFNLIDTAQIRSRHISHSNTHSDFTLLIQFGYILNTETVLIFKHTNYISTSILGWHLQAHLQQDSITSPNAIFKPIPSTTLWQVQIYGHSSVKSSFTFESRTVKLANLTLQVQEDLTGAAVVPQNFPSHLSIFCSQDLLGFKTTLGLDQLKTPP